MTTKHVPATALEKLNRADFNERVRRAKAYPGLVEMVRKLTYQFHNRPKLYADAVTLLRSLGEEA